MPGTFTYNATTNTVTVTGGTSGSPADFASFVATDRAGAGTSLLAAWTPNSNTKALTYQVRPVEFLALLISFVVAGKTAEADYIFITGTDAWGAAQTEAIDVSAGNGTYTTTKRFRTITNIDCSDNAAGGGTVWADGTVAVTQPIWGVIWNLVPGYSYRIDALLNVGDSITTAYFKDTNKQVFWSTVAGHYGNIVLVKANAVAVFGNCTDEANHLTDSGCSFRFATSALGAMYFNYQASGLLYFYGCQFLGNTGQSCNIYAHRFWNCIVNKTNLYNIADLHNTTNTLSAYGVAIQGNVTVANALLLSCQNAIYFYSSYIIGVVKDSIFYSTSGEINTNSINGKLYVVDCIDLRNRWLVGFTQTTCVIYRQQTINIRVSDNSGNNIEGATVTLKDKDGDMVCAVETGADGKIVFSGEDSSPISNAVTHTRYYYSGGNQADYRGPHTLTITKAGYQDYQDVITLDRKMDLEVALLTLKGGSPTNIGLVPLGIKQVAI